jgi:HEAT repeat protein
MTPGMDDLLQAILSGQDERASVALPALAAIDHARVVSELAGQLLEANADGRWWIARTLATISTPQSAATLIQMLNDPDSDVRACAALALGELHTITGEESAEALAAHLADESAHVAEVCTAALGRIGAAAVPTLLRALEQGVPVERIRAAKALAPIESHEAIPALVQALDDGDAIVTFYAQDALERMGVGMVLLQP